MPDDLPPPIADHFAELVRPGIPPSLGERIREQLEERGLTVGRLAGTVGVAVAVVAVGWWLLRPAPAPLESSLPLETVAADPSRVDPELASSPKVVTTSGGSTTVATAVVAHAAGAVIRPGLYRLRAGGRVADLVQAAGGLAPDADSNRLNLAAPVLDGERVYVLRTSDLAAPQPPTEMAPQGSPTAAGATPGVLATPAMVDLNTATAEELDTLPGVGPSTAEAIIEYRAEQGRFSSVDELLDVRGIGDAKLAELRDRVTV